MKKQIKCYYCKNYDDVENLVREDKITKSGRKIHKYYHKFCKEKSNKETKEWNSLYEYLKSYFGDLIPTLLIKILKEIRKKNFTYAEMQGCLEKYQGDIMRIPCDDSGHMCFLLRWYLTEHLNDFRKEQVATEQEKNIIDNFEFVEIKSNNGNNGENKNKNDNENLDIL